MEASPNAGSMVLLTRLAKVVYRRSGEELLGMRLRRFVTLSYLRDHGRVPQQQMCEMLTIDANNLVLLLNDVEIDDRIRRERDPADRRRHVVVITKQGEKDLERAEELLETLEEDLLAGLDADERATLRGLLSRALETRCAKGDAHSLASAVASSS
jgi:MarR family transcriptional regulator, temperature-dependent positive regulator of motility